MFEVCKAVSATAAVVQMAINPKMPRISHPMNRLDHLSNLVSNQEASPAMGPSSQSRWRSTGNHRLRRDQRITRDMFFRERGIKTSIQFAIYTSHRTYSLIKL